MIDIPREVVLHKLPHGVEAGHGVLDLLLSVQEELASLELDADARGPLTAPLEGEGEVTARVLAVPDQEGARAGVKEEAGADLPAEGAIVPAGLLQLLPAGGQDGIMVRRGLGRPGRKG